MYTEILILYTMTLISMPLPPPPLLYKGYDNNKSTEYILNMVAVTSSRSVKLEGFEIELLTDSNYLLWEPCMAAPLERPLGFGPLSL